MTSITVGTNPAQSVTYDASGNTLSDGTNTYAWNATGLLASVQNSNGTYNYTYDGLGRRVTAYGYTYHYNGQSTQVAYITDANNNLVARFSYGANGLPAYMTLGSGKVYRYIYDGQNDIMGLIDVSTGVKVVSYSYDSWGNIINTTDTSGINASTINPFTYRGYMYDSQTGLYYLNARYYNPTSGRFLSVDSVTPNDSASLSINSYIYCANNPVMYSDPSGQAYRHYTDGVYEYYQTSYTFSTFDHDSAYVANYGLGLFINIVVWPLEIIPIYGKFFASAAAYVLNSKVTSIPPAGSHVTMTYRRHSNSKFWYGRNVITTPQGWTLSDTGWFYTKTSF